MKRRFRQLAAYNRWANARLYDAAFDLEDGEYRRNVGLFFKSLHGTCNHLLLTDRNWMKRLTGEGDHPDRLDAILFDDLASLGAARADEDDRLLDYVSSLDEPAFEKIVDYRNMRGATFSDSVEDILSHLFNHQTHHRGQAHTGFLMCTHREPPSLDLIAMMRGSPAPDLRMRADQRRRSTS